MEHEKYVIGVDYGTDSVRAVIVNVATGKEEASEVTNYPRLIFLHATIIFNKIQIISKAHQTILIFQICQAFMMYVSGQKHSLLKDLIWLQQEAQM